MSRLFSKFAHTFKSIELLAFSKMQHFIFITQESSQYLDLKNNPYVNMIDFFDFCLYKRFAKKLIFVNK